MKKGFTLIELAIVIVIIGLITGGVLGATSLIKSAKINSVIGEIEKMGTAFRAFELEFDETPGLMTDAYDYFGSDCGLDASWGANGCNGGTNNDDCIDNSSGTACSVSSLEFRNEVRRVFVHLNLSGIRPDIPYQADSSALTECVIGRDFMESALGTPYWVSSSRAGKKYLYNFGFGSLTHDGSDCEFGSIADSMSPRILKKIDEKLDEGNGIRGKIRAIIDPQDDSYSGTDCLDAAGVYDVSTDTATCALRAEL